MGLGGVVDWGVRVADTRVDVVRADLLDPLDEVVRLLRLVLDDQHIHLLAVYSYRAEVECRESRLKELPRVGTEQIGDVSLRPAPAIVLDRLYRGAAVLDTKDKETGAIVLRVREAQHVVDQFPLIGVVYELEVPVDAFATATHQTANDVREGVVSDHGCRLRFLWRWCLK